MRVIWSWDMGLGDPALAEPRTPFGSDRATYGICASHRLEVLTGRDVRMLERRGRL